MLLFSFQPVWPNFCGEGCRTDSSLKPHWAPREPGMCKCSVNPCWMINERGTVAYSVSNYSWGTLLWNAAQTFSSTEGQISLWRRKLLLGGFPLSLWNVDQCYYREAFQSIEISSLALTAHISIFHGFFYCFINIFWSVFPQLLWELNKLFSLMSAKILTPQPPRRDEKAGMTWDCLGCLGE